MSSTGRGGKRADADFYPTPAYAVDRLLDRWDRPTTIGGCSDMLELGAGDGSIIRAVNAWHDRHARARPKWTAVELRPECEVDLRATGADVVIEAAQRWSAPLIAADEEARRVGTFVPYRWDAVFMNPPFSDALAFVQIALQLAPLVLCLERSPWIGDAVERFDFFRKRMPDEYRVGRIDFDGRGGDSIPYSWFAWDEGSGRDFGELRLLDSTPPTERVRGNLPPRRQTELL